MGMSSIQVKKANYQSILRYMLQHNVCSKAEIASELGLSIPTVAQGLKYLGEKGMITSIGTMDSAGGRKAVGYDSVRDLKLSVGVEITANHVGVVIINLSLNMVYSKRVRMKIYDTDSSYDRFAQFLNDCIEESGVQKDRIMGVGISLPAIIDESGRRIFSMNEEMRISHDFYSIMKDRIPYPLVLCNDANCAAQAEITARNTTEDEIYFLVSQSVGGAIIRHGIIDQGDTCRAGEFGHMTLHAEPDARRCYCGRIGCVNAYLSTSILAETAEGDLQHFFDELPNNRDYHAVWEEYLENLSLAIHNLNMCFNRRVIIGGYLGQYIDPYLEDVRKLVRYRDPALTERDIQIESSRQKNSASAIGAGSIHILSYVNGLIED